MTSSGSPLSQAASSHPLLANIPALPACRTPATGADRTVREEGRRTQQCQEASQRSWQGSILTPKNVSPSQSQDEEYQHLLAPSLELTLCLHYLLLFLCPHPPLPTPSLNAYHSKPSLLPRKLACVWCVHN